ncbi:hypothetical protein PENTCL1PPCAC_1253, partial [Pristionchus entomophagus]
SSIIRVDPDSTLLKTTKAEDHFNVFDVNMFNPINPFFDGPMIADKFVRACKKVLSEPGLIEKLKAKNYDVFITENFDV